MSGVYSVEDLLKLRASPLICKPSNLPAIEDILSTQDTTAKRPVTRGKSEDTNTQNETFQKRPLLDGHPKKSTTDPDRIVLGPPRRSFASSNARAGTVGKIAQEGPEDGVSTREKSSFGDRFKSGDGSDTKFERRGTPNSNGRYLARHDQDSSQNERPRRRYEEDGDESRSRRDHDRDRPKWASKDDEQDLNDDRNDGSGRPATRRDPQARSKFEQPWFRHDRGGDSLDDTRREGDRQPDWRRDRTKDRDWDKSARVEAEPEWMDAEPEEPVQVHTQEEFQRWKERMKAGSGTPDTRPSSGTPGPTVGGSNDKTTNQRVLAAEADDSMDKFLARFSEAKVATETKTVPTKAPTKTRFASLFSPPVETQNKQLPSPAEVQEQPPAREKSAPPPTSTPTTVDADQAGFARILEMLQTRSNNPPVHQHDSKPKTPLYAKDGQPKPESDRPPPPPGLMTLFGQEETSQTSPPGRHSTGTNRSADAKSPVETSHTRQQSHKDELLLNLLRQANLAPKPTPMGPHHEQRAPPGILGIPDSTNRAAMNRNQMVSPTQASDLHMLPRRETGRSMFDEGMLSGMRYHDEPGPAEPLNRRPTNGAPPPPPPFFDDSYLNLLRQTGQQPPKQPPMQVPPPGLARPPGFDQIPRPPPGWPAQQPPPPQLPQGQQQPPQQSRQPGPPPGISNIPRNMPSQYGPPNMPPQQHPNQPQRPPGGMPNFPPGMGPPPGFMNSGPSMPMFPGSSGFGRFPGGPGGGGAGGEPQQQQGPSGAGRAFMEMYSEVGRSGRGAAGGMQGFK